MLQTQLEMTQTENARLHREVGNLQRMLHSKESAVIEERQSPQGFYPVMSTPEGERQEGEVSGMPFYTPLPQCKYQSGVYWNHSICL